VTEVNLLPPELRRRQRARQLTMAVVAGMAALVLLMLVLFVFEGTRLASANKQLAAQDAANTQLQGEINGLQRFDQLKQDVQSRQALAASLTQGEVMWSGVLHDLSLVIPSPVYLTQFTGTLSSSPGSTQTLPNGAGLVGSLQFQGVAQGHPDVATWLTRLEQVTGWVNPWVSTAQLTEVGITFSGTVDLTPDATAQGASP